MMDSNSLPPEIEEEIRWYQDNSVRLAQEDVPENANWKHAPSTTTISVRLERSDVETITSVAQSRGVSLSHVVREWILAQLHADDNTHLSDALEKFERSYADLRRVIDASR